MNIRGLACRQSGFSLIELIVSVVIVSLISGGALIYLNKFNSRQKLEKAKEEVVTVINLAKSYAKGRQLPQDSTETELKYVQVEMLPGGYLVVGANGIGSTYFLKQVYESDILTVGLTPAVLYFWSGSGYLSHGTTIGKMFRNDEIAKAIIQSKNDVIGYYEITINALGQITENKYIEGESIFDFSGLIPTVVPSTPPSPTITPVPPTNTPVPLTSTPALPTKILMPTCTPSSYCSSSFDCCGNSCINNRCSVSE